MNKSVWTEDMDQLLITLWAQGDSLGVIADKFREAGHGYFTRNAIAGRRWRLKGKFDIVRDPNVVQRARRAKIIVMKEQYAKQTVPAPKPKPKPKPKLNGGGVEYLLNDGCKALLDKRGSDGLPMCCGELRCYATTENGEQSLAAYCLDHYRKYHQPHVARKATPWQSQRSLWK